MQRHAALYVEVLDEAGVLLDEYAAGLDLVAHEDGERLVGGGRVAYFDA